MKTLDRLMSRLRGKGLLALFASVLLISACGNHGVVGEGNPPEYLEVTSAATIAGTNYFNMYECQRTSVTATLYFRNGDSGNYTSRVTWSSDSPGTATVSNGDELSPQGTAYAHGTVTPVGAGRANLTAYYFGLTASIGVQVLAPDSVTVKRVVQGNDVLPPALPADQVQQTGTSTTSTGLNMGVGTTETLTVVAQLNGQERNIQTTGVEWSFLNPNNGEATINAATGVVTAITAGAPLIAVVGFDSCTYTASTQVTVYDIDSISEQAEFVDSTTSTPSTLIVGNNEKINVYAKLSACTPSTAYTTYNTCEQDISTQATLSSDTPTVVSITSPNFATAATEGGPVSIIAQFGGLPFTASDLQITTTIATLEGIRVTTLPYRPNNLTTPTEADLTTQDCSTTTSADYDNPPIAIVYIGSDIPLQYCVQGSYSNGTVFQDVTRLTSWAVSDTSLASIAGTTTPQTAGEALAATNAPTSGSIQVTATPASSSVAPILSDLTVSN